MTIPYTDKEALAPYLAARFAADTALMLVKDQTNGRLSQVCTDSLRRKDLDRIVTLPEYNDLVQEILSDTYYYN